MKRLICAALLASSAGPMVIAEPVPERPFMLWTRSEAEALKARIGKEEWAKAAYEELLKEAGPGTTLRNLFRFVVMGDVAAGEAEKKYLLGIIGTHPKKAEQLEHGGRHYDCSWDALRYDAVHPLLSAEERKGIEDTFRAYVAYQLEDTKVYTRTSWLPNMQWPRPLAAHLMALALGDRALLEQIIGSNGGWKWYFDEYITSEGFYMEEFGKHYSMIGEMLFFCRGLERIGLDRLGYGYTGKGGATMRKYIESILLAGYPRTDMPGGVPQYAKVTMGDARGNGISDGPPYLFQHSIIPGYLPSGKGGNPMWSGANMNGRDHKGAKVAKLSTPHWFEIAQAKWPEGGFDYFLARMRGPGQSEYRPTLYWGLAPLDPTKTKAPKAESYVSDERGLAFLRAGEGSTYWDSPAPAVAFQLGLYYVHYTRDCFSLLGFHAFNRPLYLNRGIADGYAGNDPWTDSLRGHSGLVVDNLPGSHVGQVPVRKGFDPLVKFVAATDDPAVSGGKIRSADNQEVEHSATIFPGVTQTRALFLTREYLLDVTRARGSKPHTYDWQVHAIGVAQPDPAWAPSAELDGATLYINDLNRGLLERRKQDPATAPEKGPETMLSKALGDTARYDLGKVRKLETGEAWSTTVIQSCATGDPATSLLGPAWYDRKIGVRISLLGEPGTAVHIGETPRYVPQPGREAGKGEKSTAPNEVGGTTLLVRRTAPETTFVALHEPIENGKSRLTGMARVAQTESAVAVAVGGPGQAANDRVMVRYDEKPLEPATLEGGGESFTFADRAHVRVSDARIDVSGDLRGMRLKVTGSPKLFVNGKEAAATIQSGELRFDGR